MDLDEEYVIKLVLCGESGAGKTSLALRYTEHSFCITQKPTIGVSPYVKTAQTTQRAYRLQIWDTSGQERFKSMLPTWFQSAMVLCFVYNTNSRASFDALPIWLAKARWAPLSEGGAWGCHNNQATIGVLIGTQVDRVTYREVDTDKAQEFAQEHNLLFVETSALTGEGIDDCFDMVCKQLDTVILPRPPSTTTYVPVTGHSSSSEEPVDDPLLRKKKKKLACCCRIV